MNVTPREHFEELDWLDLAQGSADGSLGRELQSHLVRCDTCRGRFESIRKLSDALPFAGSLVEGESRPSPAAPNPTDFEAVLRRASVRAGALAPGREKNRASLIEAFSRLGAADFAWTPAAFEQARSLARELLRDDVPLAGRIVRSALGALEATSHRETVSADGLEGVLRTVQAYVLHSEGESEKALDELERARPILEASSLVPEDDLAFWAFVSALALRDLGRAQAALEALDMAESLEALLEDFPRQARCRIVRAVILASLGKPEESIPVYEDLLARGERELEDARLLGIIHLNLGSDLIQANRLTEAKKSYARAAEILRRTGESARLVSLRAGLSTIAMREGRYQEAYEIALDLRKHFRSKNLGWDEIHTELRIVEALLRLGRETEAAETCRAILPRVRELGLPAESARAAAYLTEANLSLARLEKVSRFFERAKRDDAVLWNAA
ncbi:MAG: hypothetical protein ACRD16_14050 [Thermoanaerobaculia bacterium]